MSTVIIIGNPADGFSFVGPVTPNTTDVDEYIESDPACEQESWWMAELISLGDARQGCGLARHTDDQLLDDLPTTLTFTVNELAQAIAATGRLPLYEQAAEIIDHIEQHTTCEQIAQPAEPST